MYKGWRDPSKPGSAERFHLWWHRDGAQLAGTIILLAGLVTLVCALVFGWGSPCGDAGGNNFSGCN